MVSRKNNKKLQVPIEYVCITDYIIGFMEKNVLFNRGVKKIVILYY